MAVSHSRMSGGSGGSYSTLNMNPWKAAFETKTDTVPKGWKTSSQIAEEFDVLASSVCRKINPLIAQGRLDMRKFLVKTPSGTFRSIPHYKLK